MSPRLDLRICGEERSRKDHPVPAGLRAAGTYIGRIFALWEEQQTEGYHPIQKANGAVVETPSIYREMTAEDNLKQQYRILGAALF